MLQLLRVLVLLMDRLEAMASISVSKGFLTASSGVGGAVWAGEKLARVSEDPDVLTFSGMVTRLSFWTSSTDESRAFSLKMGIVGEFRDRGGVET